MAEKKGIYKYPGPDNVSWHDFEVTRRQIREETHNLNRDQILELLAIERATRIVTEEQSANFERLSKRDGMTGLLNPRGWQEAIDERGEVLVREGRRFAVLHTDLDDFKAINDNLSHPVGDEFIILFARVLMNSVRSVSHKPEEREDIVARKGGDENLVLIEVNSREEAEEVRKRIQSHLHEVIERLRINPRVGDLLRTLVQSGLVIDASIGLSYKEWTEEELTKLRAMPEMERAEAINEIIVREIMEADEDMYAIKRAKKVGR